MFNHVTVLLNEAVEGLNVKPDGIYVDCTLGGAGHSSLILKQLTTGHLYCFDQDIHAIEAARERLEKIGNQFTIIQSNFKNLKSELHLRGVEHVDGILFDLGVSSPQFDDGARGFSYNYDARLDMRMNQEASLDAHYIVNHYSYEQLVEILYKTYKKEAGNPNFWQIMSSLILLKINKLIFENKSGKKYNDWEVYHSDWETWGFFRFGFSNQHE